jgi:redox-regulated HSP33 family molecular chaperone
MSDAPQGLPGAPDAADAGAVDAVDAAFRFTVEHQAVRGEFVRLGPAWLALREHADYPAPVRRLLGEAAAAAALLAATLKFDGELTLQLQGDGAVRLLVAQCTHDLRVRAVARFDAARFDGGAEPAFAALVGDGQLVVTLESRQGGARYQGIVPLAGGSLAAALESYFGQSEQLPTAVVLGADDGRAAGLLVQRLPQAGGTETEAPLAAREAEADRTLEDASRWRASPPMSCCRGPSANCSAAPAWATTCACTRRERSVSVAAAAASASPACCVRSAPRSSTPSSPSRARSR